MPWQKRRRTLCASRWPDTRTKSGPYTKRLRRIRPGGGRGQQFREQQRRGEGIRGSCSCLAATRTCSSARTGKDGRKQPEETKRPSALETKSVTRKTLELYAASVREFCNWSGLSADSNVEVLEVDRLLSKFMNLLFSEGHRAWRGEKMLASVPFFCPSFSQLEGNRPARSFRTLKGLREASPSFSRRTLPSAVWSALAVECEGSVVCWRLCSHQSCSKPISDQRKCCHSDLRVSWHRRRVASEAR